MTALIDAEVVLMEVVREKSLYWIPPDRPEHLLSAK